MEYARQAAKKLDIELDENYIKHIGFLFSRDAMAIFSEAIDIDNN